MNEYSSDNLLSSTYFIFKIFHYIICYLKKIAPPQKKVLLPGSKLRTSTESLEGGMSSAATSQSLVLIRLYSTLKAVIGEPPFARGIQVT